MRAGPNWFCMLFSNASEIRPLIFLILIKRTTYTDPTGKQRTWESAERSVRFDGLKRISKARMNFFRHRFSWQQFADAPQGLLNRRCRHRRHPPKTHGPGDRAAEAIPAPDQQSGD